MTVSRRAAGRIGPRTARSGPRAARSGLRARGRRDGQDAGDHAPHRLRRGQRTSSGPARCSPSPSPRGRRGRCAAGCAGSGPGRCRRAPSTRPRCASCSTSGRRRSAGRRRGSWSRRSRWSPRRAAACRIKTDRAALRDLASEIEWCKSTQTAPEDYPTARRQGPEGAAARARRGQPGLRGLRGAQAGARLHRLRGRAAAHHRRARIPAGRRRAGARAVPALRRRRVPGRQPAAAAAARPVARAARLALRGRRREPDHLLVHRGHARVPARLPRPLRGRHGHPAGPRLPLHAAGGRRGERAARRDPAGHRGRAARGPGPARAGRAAARRAAGRVHRVPGRGGGGRGRRREHQDADRARRRGRPRSRCCSGSTRSPRSTSRRWRTAACPTWCAASSASSTGPRCARPCCCCAARPARAAAADSAAGDGGRRSRRRCVRCSPATAGRPKAPAGSGAAARAMGVAGRARPRWPRSYGRSHPRGRARRIRAPNSRSAPPCSTPRSWTASPSPRCTPPRAWSGTRCTSSG